MTFRQSNVNDQWLVTLDQHRMRSSGTSIASVNPSIQSYYLEICEADKVNLIWTSSSQREFHLCWTQPVLVTLSNEVFSTISDPAQPHPPLLGSGALNTDFPPCPNPASLGLAFDVIVSYVAFSLASYSRYFFIASRFSCFFFCSAK